MKESQLNMLQHSEVKIKLLNLYLARYLRVISLAKFFGDIYLYDLFCGEGLYENDGKGSPIIFLESIVSLVNQYGNSYRKFHCIFNDIDKKKIIKLKSVIDERRLHNSEIVEIHYSKEDYRVIIPEITAEIKKFKKHKAFVFIDPYGYKDVMFSDIKALLETKKSEVLLFLPTQFMFRFEEKGTPECLIEFIKELMPVSDWPTSDTSIDFIENLKDAFRKRLGNEYYVDSFIISRSTNQFYCLFFFTSHIYGFDRMLDAKWKIDEEQGRGWSYQSENNLFNQLEKKADTYKFENKLVEYLKTERSNGDLYEFRVHNGHLETHANEILLKLQNEGRLNSLKADGTPARKSSFYLSYKEYKKEPKKIKIKLK